MATLDPEEANVPWGKYNYQLEGLATGCYMEGVDTQPRMSSTATTIVGQRLRFRVELPARCFVLSVAIKLPNAPSATLVALDDIVIERALSDGDYQVVYDPAFVDPTCPSSGLSQRIISKAANRDDPNNDSPTAVDQTSATNEERPRKKVMEVHRAADSLRLTIADVDEAAIIAATSSRPISDSEDASESTDFRTLGVVVVGYIRGQTPASNRLKILLNSSARLQIEAAKADRAEVDGLLGLAFLASRRYRQAAELLQRASELILSVASDDAKAGFAVDAAVTWAAELNLLSAHAYFEHMPLCNDGIVRLVLVASASASPRLSKKLPRDVSDLTSDFLDLRTELLSMLQPLIHMLVRFLAESTSPAVRMASARMVEFISEQLGCGMAPHMSTILNHVLRAYPSLVAFGARERAAASSFSYDSMEDCFERLIDICCRLFPLTEHSVLHRLYDNTLVPVFLDAFLESNYLQSELDGDEPNELLTTAVAQTLRVIYLVLSILGADARVPTSLVTRVLNILVLDSGCPKTPLLLRRTALHVWDALSRSLTQAAYGNTIKAFEDHLRVLTAFLPKLLVETVRVGFEYRELDEDNGVDVQVFKEEDITPRGASDAVSALLLKRKFRTEIVDRHTLHRLLALITDLCGALGATETADEDVVHTEVLFSLQQRIGQAIADVAMSNLLDVSYHEAVSSGIGTSDNSSSFEFGHISNQLIVVGELLQELFASYWACLSLLPSRMAEEAVRASPIRVFLGWCVDRLKYTAPPRGMLQILTVCVKGLMNDISVCMLGSPKDPDNPSDITFLSIYRAHLTWLPQAAHEEAFDLLDLLNENVAGDLLALDLLLIVKALGDQRDEYQARTETSLESVATIIAAATPKDPELAVKSLRDLPESMAGKQRLSNGFPKSSQSGSFNKKLNIFSSQAQNEPMVKAFYLHVVLSSCFNRFDSLREASERRAGPNYMGDKIDAFVEHAALAVRSLHACARSQSHREYIAAILGDIFGTCLAMQDHTDGRVRLAGFEIFAASLDVLFLAQKATVLGAQQANFAGGDALNSTGGAVPPSSSQENVNGVVELLPKGDDDPSEISTSGMANRSMNINELAKSNFVTPNILSSADANGDQTLVPEEGDEAEDSDKKMNEILADGGTWTFKTNDASSGELEFEQRAWQMLCAFISSSLGVGKYVDFVVQRACLEYLRNCMMNALRGRSSGANVIAFEHIDVIWEVASRLVGSPWRALNSLAMWVTCAVVNVSVFAASTARMRGAGRQRTTQLIEFVSSKLFPRSEMLLKDTSRENRVWGMRLLEVYIQARSLNLSVTPMVPQPPGRILRCLQTLKNDWHEDVRERSKALLQINYNSMRRKTTNLQTLTVQAQNFMYMKRQIPEESDSADPSGLELWFPPLPKQLSETEVKVYQSNLDAFASNEIAGGEEVDLVKDTEEEEEEEEEGAYDDDEDGYELDVDAKIEAVASNFESPSQENGEKQLDGMGTKTEENEENGGDGDDDDDDDDDAHETDEDEKCDDVVAIEQRSENSREEGEESNGADSPDSSSSSTDAEAGSDPDELAPSTDVKELDLRNIEKVVNEHDIDEDFNEDDDKEFSDLDASSPGSNNPGPTLVTQVSDVDDDVDMFVEDEEHVDVEEDEDVVVDVTDVEDVLMDLGTDADVKPKHSGLSLHGGTSTDFNPDLDEAKTVLHRKGSFTARPTTTITLEEGDAPKLARRRSVDVGSLTISTEGFDDMDVPPPRSNSRLSRRNSSKTIVAALRTSEGNRSRSGEGSFTMKKGGEVEEHPSTAAPRVVRHRSRKSVAQMVEEKDSLERKALKDREGANDRPSVGGEDVPRSGSFKGPRIMKSLSAEDSIEDTNKEARPPMPPSNSGGSSSSSKDRIAQIGGDVLPRPGANRPARRSLPRAPAFVMGGGLQRRNSGPLIASATRGDSLPSRSGGGSGLLGSSDGRGEGSGSASISRVRLPRGKSYGGRVLRPNEELDDSFERRPERPDRSHRFGRRGPLKVEFDGVQDVYDEDIFDDVDLSNAHDNEKKGSRSGTPTKEGANDHLADELRMGEGTGVERVRRREASKRS